MTTYPPSSVHLKLERAEQHLKRLNKAVQDFMAGDPESIPNSGGLDIKFNGPQGKYLCKARIPKPPPLRWGVIVGEILYDLRSALDHLAWQLVKINNGTPTSRTEFPIFKSKLAFDADARSKMRGMAPSARTTIEELQPFHAEEDADVTLLWLLHELTILDKHRILGGAAIYLGPTRVHLHFPHEVPFRRKIIRDVGPLEDGAIIVDAQWDPVSLPPKAEVNVDLDLAFDVVFGNGGDFSIEQNPAEGLPFVNLLRAICDHVRDDVVTRFAAEFG